MLQTLSYFTELLIMKDQQVEIMSEHYVQRFKTLLEGEMLNLQIKRHRDAQSIMNEYLCDGVEDDNYQWLFINDLTELKEAN